MGCCFGLDNPIHTLYLEDPTDKTKEANDHETKQNGNNAELSPQRSNDSSSISYHDYFDKIDLTCALCQKNPTYCDCTFTCPTCNENIFTVSGEKTPTCFTCMTMKEYIDMHVNQQFIVGANLNKAGLM